MTLSRLLLVSLAGWWAVGVCAAPSSAAGKPPAGLDCAELPCAEVLPRAESFQPVEGAVYWEGVDAGGTVVGWVALSTDLVDIKAYSGKPMVTLLGLDPDGVITAAKVVHHSEPILLIGIPEQALHDFVSYYAGKSALERIVVGRARKPGTVSVDAISGATVTVLAQNFTILESARILGVAVGVIDVQAVAPGHFVSDPVPWTFPEMLERGALGRLSVTEAEMGVGKTSDPYVDLYFGVVDAPHIGRSLLGERDFDYYMGQLAADEHLFVIFGRGSGSFKGSGFVRGGIFDRVRLQQGLREITFRDTDYYNFPDTPSEGAPAFDEGALFVLRGGRFDPGAAYELVFLGSRYDGRGAFTRDFREFTADHQLPESVYQVEAAPTGFWQQAWSNRRVDAAILGAYLACVMGVFLARRYTTANPQRLERIHLASMVFGFVVVGIYMGAQPSVTQILTAVESVVHEWRWELFLSEPLIFISWCFIFVVSVIWGRGVFCGWVCPYGAMTELVFKAGKRLGVSDFELPERLHLPLRNIRYGVLAVLVVVFLWDSILGERLAEIEPFKSTFLVPAWTRHWGFLSWWLLLLVLSTFWYRPFCRYLCPLGAGLSIMSSARPSGPRRRRFCSSCKICSRGCEPRAFRSDGSIDQRECLSCMECEATYRNEEVCPPLIGIRIIEGRGELTEREKRKLEELRLEVIDL